MPCSDSWACSFACPGGSLRGQGGPGRGHNNLPFSSAPQGQTAGVKLTRADLRGLGFWDTYRVVLLGDSSCFKLEATLNREQIHEVFLPWKETKGLKPQSWSLDSLGQKLRGEGPRKQRPEVVTVEAEGTNSRTLPDQQQFPEPEVCKMRGVRPSTRGHLCRESCLHPITRSLSPHPRPPHKPAQGFSPCQHASSLMGVFETSKTFLMSLSWSQEVRVRPWGRPGPR